MNKDIKYVYYFRNKGYSAGLLSYILHVVPENNLELVEVKKNNIKLIPSEIVWLPSLMVMKNNSNMIYKGEYILEALEEMQHQIEQNIIDRRNNERIENNKKVERERKGERERRGENKKKAMNNNNAANDPKMREIMEAIEENRKNDACIDLPIPKSQKNVVMEEEFEAAFE